MGPVELIYIAVGLVIVLIGLARGYALELGNTVLILVAIFVLTFLESRIVSILRLGLSTLPGLAALNPEMRDLIVSLTFQAAFVAIVFASYAGKTFNFGGAPIKPPAGTIYTTLIALLNAYLISGTLWYYQHSYDYPIKVFGLVQLPLTQSAQTMVQYLPQTLFPTPIYWMIPVALILILRVRG